MSAQKLERGEWTRASIALQVTLTVVLAVAAAGILTWLSERPGLRWRKDLTAGGENTLHPATMTVIDALPDGDPVVIDVFFRPEPAPLTAVAGEAQARFFKLLVLADSLAAGRIRVKLHDFEQSVGPQSEAFLRMRELGVENPNVVVFSRGRLRSEHRLLGDIATLDLGNVLNPQGAYVPPTIEEMHTEEVLILGLRKVTQQERFKVYFSTGHNELDIYGEGNQDMGLLHTAMIGDGFDIAWWDEAEDGAVPDDASALAIIGPSQPFSAAGRKAIDQYVRAGGRLLIAPDIVFDREGSASDLMKSFGIRVEEGLVSEPFVAANGQLGMGNQRVALIESDASEMLPHPITNPLRQADRRLLFARVRALKREGDNLPPGGRVLNLVRSDDLAWIDTYESDGKTNFRVDEHEEKGTFALAVALAFSPTLPAAPKNGQRPESRILALGTADFFANHFNPYNQDFLINGLNWLVGRELRAQVATKDPDARRIDLEETSALSTMLATSLFGLPAVFFLFGVVIFVLRRRV